MVRQRYAYHNEDNGSLASSSAGHVYPIDSLETDGRERRDRLRNVRRGIGQQALAGLAAVIVKIYPS